MGSGGGGGDGGRFSRFPLNLLPGNLTICTGLRSQGLEILCGFIGLIDLKRSYQDGNMYTKIDHK